jgi:hypothetical protein
MAKPDGRIEKGQRLSTAISARAWNRAQDAADIVLGVRPGFSAESVPGGPARLAIPMKISGGSFEPGFAVSYNRNSAVGFRVLGDDKYADFECLEATVYQAANGSSTTYPYGTAIGITLEGGGEGSVVPVVICGIAACRLNVITPQFQFAKAAMFRTVGESSSDLRGHLETTECGCEATAKILFIGDTIGGTRRWAIVSL